MNHPLDHIIKISEVTENLGPEISRPNSIFIFDIFMDKGFVADKVSGDYDISSTLPVAEDGYPSNQEESGNIFMVTKIENYQNLYSSEQLGDSNQFYMPDPNSLTLLSTSQLSNFLTWTPDGIPFTADINIGAAVPA